MSWYIKSVLQCTGHFHIEGNVGKIGILTKATKKA